MQKLTILFAIIILLTLTSCEKKFDIQAEKETLKSLSEKMYNSFQNGDIEFPKKYINQDWELFLTNENYQGRISKEDWLKSFDKSFKPVGKLNITVNDIKWIVTPTMAISKSNETWESSIHTQPQIIHYLTTVIYEKKNDQWYAVHVHQSYLP